MIIPAATLAVIVKANGVAATNAELMTVNDTLKKTETASVAAGNTMIASSKKFKTAGKAMTKYVTLPLLAIGAASADMALTFNRDMNLVRTQAGASAKETAWLKKEVMGLSRASKFGPDEVAEALYRVRSAGFKGAKAMAVVQKGVELATLGNSNLEMTTKALTGAAKSLDLEGSKAMKHLAAEMNATVGTGDMRMEELQDALSTGVLPAFVNAGLGMRDYASALTVMTDRNVPAQVASTRLRTAITMLVPHSKKAEEALAGVGIQTEDLANIMRNKGLPQAIAFLAEHLDDVSKNKQNRIEIEAFGGAKSSATIETLVENYQELFEKEQLIGAGIHKYNSELKAAEQNPLTRLQRAWANIEADLIEIGEVITPIIVPMLIKAAQFVTKLVGKFQGLSPEVKKLAVMAGLALITVGPLLRLIAWFLTPIGKLLLLTDSVIAFFSGEAAAAEEAAVANASYAESLAAVNVAQKELLIANASGMVTQTVPIVPAAAGEAEAAGASAAGAGAGKSAAMGMAGGMARMLPIALAAIGIGNIISSVVGGDQKGAIYKSGGMVAGAIAGGLAFGLPGALAGAGIGSILGGEIGKMFGDHKTTALQRTMQKQASHAADALDNQRKAVKRLHSAEGNLASANQRSHKMTDTVTEAHKRMNAAVHKFGPASSEARKAMHELTILEHRNAQAAKGVENAHRLSGHQLKLYRHETLLAVSAEKARLPSIQEDIKQMNRRYDNEKKRGHENWKLLHQIVDKEKTEGKIRTTIQHQVAEAAQVGGKKFAQALKSMNSEQASLGRHFHGIQIGARHVKESMEDYATKGTLSNEKFAASSTKGSEIFREDARKISEASGIAAEKIENRLAKALQKMGVASVQFGVKDSGGGKGNKKGAHKQTGGVVVPGTGHGDKVPVHAMVEPGEVLHVLNRNAAQFHTLEKANRSVPRFQRGGNSGRTGGVGEVITGGSNMSVGSEPQILNDLKALSAELHKVVYVISGYRTPQHSVEVGGFPDDPHTEGAAADIGVGSGLRDSMFGVKESQLKRVGLYRPFYPPDPNEVNHVQLFGKQAPGGAFTGAVPQLSEPQITGPDGKLKTLAQLATKADTGAANKYLRDHAPEMSETLAGSAGISLKGITGSVASQAAQIVKRTKAEYVPALALFEALWAESGMGAAAPGNVLQALEPYTKVMPAAQEIAGFLTGSPHWTGTSAIATHRANPDLPANAVAQLVQKSGVGEGNEGRANYLLQKQQAISTMKQFGLFTGSHAKSAEASSSNLLMEDGKKKKTGLGKEMGHIIKGIGKGKHLPKFHGEAKKFGRKIQGIGLNEKWMENMGDVSSQIERYEEFATNASANTITDEATGVVTQGTFRGHDEASYINMALASTMHLRKEVIASYKKIKNEYINRVTKLLTKAKNRLTAVMKKIREAEQEKQKNEKKIHELDTGGTHKKVAIEQELKELEHKLSKATKAKTKNPKEIEQLHASIHQKKLEVSGNDKGTQEEIKKLKEANKNIGVEQKARGRVQASLEGTFIPGLTEQQKGLYTTAAGLMGESAQVGKKNINIIGLKSIQGQLDPMSKNPDMSELGGRVFTDLTRLREIQAEADKKPEAPTADEGGAELAGIYKEIALQEKLGKVTAEAQNKVIASYKGPEPLKYAGAFANGGVMAAVVGERGPEIAVGPRGTRVLGKRDAIAAVSGSNAPTKLVIEELHVHPDEGKATLKIGGKEFEAEVQKVQKKTSRRSSRPAPGSRRG